VQARLSVYPPGFRQPLAELFSALRR